MPAAALRAHRLLAVDLLGNLPQCGASGSRGKDEADQGGGVFLYNGMYVVVDDIWQQVAPGFIRPGPAPTCSDSELLTLFLISECLGWDVETQALSQWQAHRDLFPNLPSQSRANRRRRALQVGFNLVRQVVLRLLDVAQDRQCAIDSLPVPVMAFHTVPTWRADWKAAGATFGRVTTKRQTIFGYKLHLLVTLNGVILDVELAPANVADITAGYELLASHHDLVVIGDKAYIGQARATALRTQTGTVVLTGTRRTQHQQAAPIVGRVQCLIYSTGPIARKRGQRGSMALSAPHAVTR